MKQPSDFNEIEIAVLAEIVKQHAEDAPSLAHQLKAAKVSSRENTGKGFYTDLEIARQDVARIERKGPLGEVWLAIDGFSNPMTFLLFLEDGYACQLEGATINDSTVDYDFSTARFARFKE